ncbi:hypothetical protein SLEP1_g24109 [Rubroshorea leprosula]|uniref:Uncharacterized protein n=1 Tax=Rubroshorea leprosula TaxID=152421 RepID=A0AAV5JHK1_9ROSI|nr:hypothetical protein SLEP1_g24109 [Rubroshorea leprosula]
MPKLLGVNSLQRAHLIHGIPNGDNGTWGKLPSLFPFFIAYADKVNMNNSF